VSLFPPTLWRPSPKDLAADLNPAQSVFLQGSSQAAATVTAFTGQTTQVPADKVLLVNSVSAVGAPGAAQFVTRGRLRWGITDAAGVTFTQALGDLKQTGTIVGAVLAEVAMDWQPGAPGFVLLQGQAIAATFDFNAGAAANVVSLTVNGILIPRGNWQRS